MARPPDPDAKKRLLQAARTEFVAHGLDGARVEQMARRAGLSKGAFYLHFPSKADAFNELVGSVMRQLNELVSACILDFRPQRPEDAEPFLQQRLDSDLQLFEFLLDHRDVVGLILEGGGSGSTQHLVEEFALQAERQTAVYLRVGIEAGLYRADMNVEATAAFIAGGYDRVARRLLDAPEGQDLRALIRSWQQQVIMGVGTPALMQAAGRMAPEATPKSNTEMEGERPMTNTNEPTHSSAPAKASADRVKAPLVGVITGLALVGGLGFWTVQRINAANAAQQQVAERRADDTKKATESANSPPTVEVVQGTVGQWLASVELTGTLEAAESAKLAFRLPGKLRTINGQVGDVVRAGHVLATLDSSETRAQLAVNEAQIKASEAQLALATDAERRTQTLVQSGSAAEASGVQTEKQKALAAAQLEAARAQESLIRVNLSNQTLVAPFPGTLTHAPKGVGAVVNPGEALFELINTESLNLASTVAEGDAGLVVPGATVTLRTENGEASGVVRAVLGTLDPQTRRVPLQVEFKNPGFLRAGAFVRAWVTSQKDVPIVRLPHTVLRPGSHDEILVVKPEGGVLEQRKIVYVTDTDGALLARSGVSATERVVVSPTAEAKSGDRVQVKPVTVGKASP